MNGARTAHVEGPLEQPISRNRWRGRCDRCGWSRLVFTKAKAEARVEAHRCPIERAAERFWSKVARRATEECWPFIGGRVPFGYGTFYFQGRLVLAHRISWVLTNGEIPNGLCVLHRCDNPPCVNPSHLFLGTKSDNTLDASAKGRLAYRDYNRQRDARGRFSAALAPQQGA